MKKKNTNRKSPRPKPKLSMENFPFSYLVRESKNLKKIRQDYQSYPSKERWQDADYQYHASAAVSLFSMAIDESFNEEPSFPGELFALAIDPNYAPAILTIGSYEYIYGRPEEAMKYFLSLIAFPEDTEDIITMIDKAGDFLLDNKDYKKAEILYSRACDEHPNIAVYRNGLSYCLSKLGHIEEALDEVRKSIELEPDNHIYLTDLGWTLVEAEKYEEAKKFWNERSPYHQRIMNLQVLTLKNCTAV